GVSHGTLASKGSRPAGAWWRPLRGSSRSPLALEHRGVSRSWRVSFSVTLSLHWGGEPALVARALPRGQGTLPPHTAGWRPRSLASPPLTRTSTHRPPTASRSGRRGRA